MKILIVLVTVFIKESFLNHSVAEKDLDWYKIFLETQMFFNFQDERLRKEDLATKKLAEQRKGKA